MRAPDFWFKSGDWRAWALSPIAVLYGALAAWRLRQRGATAPIPVICIGNLTAGGAGKTPTAIAIAAMLRGLGERPVFLTRGYGGTMMGPHRVDPTLDKAEAVGDEALLLARHAPTIKSVDRIAGATLASGYGTVIVMDDGLQNPSLEKDFSIAVIDAETGLGNGLCIPAGPLRAPLAEQKERIDAVLVMGDGHQAEALQSLFAPRPFWRAALVPDDAVIARLKGRSVYAFAGIGRPDKFFNLLQQHGVVMAVRESFGDHQSFSKRALTAIAARCARDHLIPVTTEKDAARLGAQRIAQELPALVSVPVTWFSHDEATITAALKTMLAQKRR